MEFMEGLPKYKEKEVIMVMVDWFNKYTCCMALSHPDATPGVAKVFMNNVYKLHRLPALMVSDRDPMCLRKFWKEMFSIQGVNLLYSFAYHPQTDGQTEIINRFIEKYLRCMTGDCSSRWVRWLSLVEWWYNTNFHSTTKLTLNEVLYSFPPLINIPYFSKDSTVELVDEAALTRR
jgi:hypothetical protein